MPHEQQLSFSGKDRAVLDFASQLLYELNQINFCHCDWSVKAGYCSGSPLLLTKIRFFTQKLLDSWYKRGPNCRMSNNFLFLAKIVLFWMLLQGLKEAINYDVFIVQHGKAQ